MLKKLIHKLKIRFGKKIKVAPHISYGVTHVTDEALNSCWGSVTLPEQYKLNYRETDYRETH